MLVKGKTFIVTGAGMGRELTLELLRRGASVAGIDISGEKLVETKQLASEFAERLSIQTLDIIDQDAVESLPKIVKEFHGQVDGVINNARIIQPFIDINELDFDVIRRVMDINFYGTLYLVKALLPELLSRPEAHIVNISSMGGFLPVPGQSVYGASKAAVKLLTEGLHSELKDTSVKVSVVFPGAVKTEITKNSGAERKSSSEDDARAQKITTPQEAATIMINGIEKDKYRIFVGRDSRMMDFLYRLMPKKAAAIIADKLKT